MLKARQAVSQITTTITPTANGAATVMKVSDWASGRTAGVSQLGTVHYADQIQVLVKWDDGASSSLRVGVHELRVVTHGRGAAGLTQ